MTAFCDVDARENLERDSDANSNSFARITCILVVSPRGKWMDGHCVSRRLALTVLTSILRLLRVVTLGRSSMAGSCEASSVAAWCNKGRGAFVFANVSLISSIGATPIREIESGS